MAEVVWKLFCNSTAVSSRRTYSVSFNHLERFVASCQGLPQLRFRPQQLSLNGMVLCFYTAYLFRLTTINSANTISNYSSQLKSAWSKIGLTITDFDDSVRGDIIKGARRLLPAKPDTRPAFLLPHYFATPVFAAPQTISQLRLKAAVTWGFLGMFRFATYEKLGIDNLVVVGKNPVEHRLKTGSLAELTYYFTDNAALGFYFHFPDKYHPLAYAFFCNLGGISAFWSKYCPVQILFHLSRAGILSKNIFPRKTFKSALLSNYLRFIGPRSIVMQNKFTPHSLRIGGHTFYSIKNMDPDFVHFLGRRAISRACQLYYRANAYDNVVRLDMFFRSISSQHILQR